MIQLFRLLQIYTVLMRYQIDHVVLHTPALYPLRFFAYLNPRNWQRKKIPSRAVRLRLAFEALGPIFVKFGQALSTRRDLIPEDIADELAHLQDQVPPFASSEVQAILEKVYKKPLNELWLDFNLQPLASASIAQVHSATLFDGRAAVVKILRPNIEKLIKRDVKLLYFIASFIQKHWSEGPRLRPIEVVTEFKYYLDNELDLLREGANATQLRRNFHNSPLLYVPEIYWPYARSKVLVMERIHGIPISQIETLKAHGINLRILAERGVEIFFTQVFRDCFFHADMHPGNIFVSSIHPLDPHYIAVDFGIMGSLNPNDQRYLAENLLAFFKRDYRRVAQLHIESGWVSTNTRIDEFEAAIRTICEPIFARPLKEISCGQMLLQLFKTASRFNMQVQPQLILLQKTLFNIEGLGRQLYPDLDLWNTAKPFLERWIKQQLGIRAMFRKVSTYAPYWAERLPEIPELIYQVLSEYRTRQIYLPPQQITKRSLSSLSCFFLGFLSSLFLATLLLLKLSLER